MHRNGQSIWLEINLAALRRNIRRLQGHTNRPVMAVVKANGYGHGIVESAREAVAAGSIYLCVARIEEALKIRHAGVESPILVMGYTQPEEVEDAVAFNVTLTAADFDTADAYGRVAAGLGKVLRLHAKIDSGMGRLGVLSGDGFAFCQHIRAQQTISLEGLFTHFACADELNNPATNDQIKRFNILLEVLQQQGIKPGLVHAANSAASIYHPGSWYDAIRPGIAIYGLNPAPDAPLPQDFEEVLTWKCLLSSVKIMAKGSGIGYGHQYVTTHDERIGAATAGYADGLRRWQGNVALVRGRRIHQAGGICMDQSMWHLDNVPDASVGDEVILIGKQGMEEISAEAIAQQWGTINYEVVCGLTDRVHRVFIDDEAGAD